MKILDCRRFWPGRGPVLSGVRLVFDRGRVAGLESCSGGVSGLVMPSFIDAHMHFSWKASSLSSLDLSTVAGCSEMLSLVERAPSSSDPVLRGIGFDESMWDFPALPSMAELDAVTGERPTVLTRVCGHLSLVNSALLRRIPPGVPGVDRTTGRLVEGASLGFSRMFPVASHALFESMDTYTDTVYSRGVTGTGTMEHLREARLISEWGPGFRTAIGVFSEDAAQLAEEGSGELVRWVKVFLDGSFGAGNASVTDCYTDGSSAEPLMSDESLAGFFESASKAGLGVCVHAIGGRALEQTARVSALFPEVHVRVEHAEEILPVIDAGFSPGVHSFCMQPNFVSRWQMPEGMYETRLPRERVRCLNPFGSVLSRGFRLGFGSDGMPFGPLEGLGGATAHPSPDQRLSVEESLHAYTLGAADVCGFSDLACPVAPGRPAHLCVLSHDPFQGTPWEDIRVSATLLDGEVVFGDPGIVTDHG